MTMTMSLDYWPAPEHLLTSVILVILLYWKGQTLLQYAQLAFVSTLSRIINSWLLYTKPITSTSDARRKIPTCPYQFPSGQGDVAKFLEGTQNSALWSRTHGNVYRIWSGTNPEIVLLEAGDIKTVFRDSHKHTKALNNNAGRVMRDLLGQCVGLISHTPYKTLRAVLDPYFNATASMEHAEMIRCAVRSHFEDMHDKATSNLQSGQIDPVTDLAMLPFWIVARLLYNELDQEARVELEALIPLRENLFMSMIQGGISRFWWSKFLPLRINRDLRRWKSSWLIFNRRMATASPESLVGRLWRRIRSGEVTEEHVNETLDEMLFANLDVTMGSISWNLVFLAAYPEFQAQLRKEYPQRSANREDLHAYLKSESTLLHVCILESARLRPLAAFTVPQAAPSDRVVGASTKDRGLDHQSGGYSVPAGTCYTIDTHTLNIRQLFWGKSDKERYAYQPQRFRNIDCSEARYNYWRFGFGPRQCVGKYIADIMVKSLLIHLVLGYDLTMFDTDKDQDWQRSQDTWIAQPKIMLRCVRRDSG